ncbi:hypothetical protein Efla_006610 [Eimeria flavescens]
MLLRAKVFSFKCTLDDNGSFVDDQRVNGHNYICDEQDASVQSLFVITLAVHCTMSALAGTMMDTLGPKITSMLGQLFHITGWSLISTLTPESHAVVYLGFIFIGLGADTAFLPTLLVTRLFPGAAASVITLIGSASSASFAIPLILNTYLTDDGISGCWWYVGLGPCLFLIIDSLVMPLKAFKVFEDDSVEQQQQRELQPSVKNLALDQQETGEFSSKVESAGGKNHSGQLAEAPLEVLSEDRFFQTLFSEKYVLVVIYFIAVGWSTSFYQEAHDRILVPLARDFLGSMLPFSFVPCILLGKLAEVIGILPVMALVNSAGLLAYTFTLRQAAATGIISVLCPLFHLTVGLGPKGMYVVQLPMIGLLLLMYFVIARMWVIKRRSSQKALSLCPPGRKALVTPEAGSGCSV